ncbi:glycosyltransferase family 4 protein [Pedobacter nanyangensis]|uniref:glycosyltransferase family 4 protein n=1 Tax=Pedobacter nanyangensis TaxID=1562389 RepID=UPI000DE4CB25|nr:glycosyltransferase family 4 protein [Pedobacter nanyangensis]
MRILIVITRGDSIGGAQTHVLSIAKGLKANGDQVLVAFGGKEGVFSSLLKAEGINYALLKHLKRPVRPVDDFRAVYELCKLIKSYKPNLVALHSSKAGILGRIAGAFTKVPTVVTIHGWSFTDGISNLKAIFYKSIEKALARLADKLIVVSDYDLKLGLDNGISHRNAFVRIYNGIYVDDQFEIERKTKKDKVEIIMVARFDNQKDHSTLIKACKDIENIQVRLLGDGPNMEAMVALVKSLYVEDKFIFEGYQSNVGESLRRADIFVLISNWEGFPISTLEAMNYGLPVVVSDVGGASEAVKDGISGFLVQRGDVEALRERILMLVENPVLRQDMGRHSRQFLQDNFTQIKMFEETYQVYREIAKL